MTGEQLVDEVKEMCGRPTDTVLLTDTRVTRWLNEAQRDIAERCPGLDELSFKNVSSLALVTDTISYAIGDITVSDSTLNTVCDIYNVFHMKGSDSCRLDFLPNDEFDSILIDPTSSEHSAMRPARWTKRGSTYIELAPRPSSDYNGDYLRVDGMFYPLDFTVNSSNESELDDADEGMIRYAISHAWAAIGDFDKSAAWMMRYEEWIEKYKENYAIMDAWNYNFAFDNDA